MSNQKPDWITTTAGPHPAFTRSLSKEGHVVLTPEEKEFLQQKRDAAVEQVGGIASKFSDEETIFLADCERRKRVAEQSLATFQDESIRVEDRQKKIFDQRYALATALYQLGEYESALKVVSKANGTALSGFKELRGTIFEMEDADLFVDDPTDHDCPRPLSEDGKIELDRHHKVGLNFSRKHGRVLPLWRCQVCNRLNLTPESPERQIGYGELRANARAAVGNRQGKAAAIPVELSDDRLLRIPS